MKYKLSEIGKVAGGGTPSTKHPEYYTGSGIPWITPKDLSGYDKMYISKGGRDITQEGLENSSAKLLPANSILVSSRAPIGYVAIAENEIATNQGFKSIIPNRELVIPEYLYFVMKTSKQDLEQIASGSTFKEVSTKVMSNFEVEIPSLDEQSKVLDYLLPITRKIEKNSRINDNLLELANVIFTNQISKDTTQLSNIATIQNGYAFKSKEYVSQKQLLVLRTKNIGSNHLFNKLDVVYIDQHSFNEYKKFAFKKFDTVLVMVGASIGKTGFITSNVLPALQNQNMWRFRAKNSSMPGLLLYEYINYINKRVKGSASGSARSFYRKKLFSNFEVPIIDNNNIFSMFEKIQLQINNIQVENNALSKLKQNLLNKYF